MTRRPERGAAPLPLLVTPVIMTVRLRNAARKRTPLSVVRDMPRSLDAKRKAFRALHAEGCFVLPNPWDVGGVRRLERRGFQALATSSAACAWALGREDGEITLDEALTHLRALCESTDLPVNADFENGFGDDPAVVARNVVAALDTGVAGLSIEDRIRRGPLYDVEHAVQRVAAASDAIRANGADVVLVARCEAFLVGRTDLDEVVERVRALVKAGADCVYAPGVLAPEQLRRLVESVAPVPVNVGLFRPGLTVAQLAELGVRRISLASALAKAAWRAFDEMLDSLASTGGLPVVTAKTP